MQEHEEESEAAAIDPDNAIAVTLDDLSEDRRRKIERELEGEAGESTEKISRPSEDKGHLRHKGTCIRPLCFT